MEKYLASTRLEPFKNVDDSLILLLDYGYGSIGPELTLNYKYLDSYRYSKKQAYLYENIMQRTFEQFTWKKAFGQSGQNNQKFNTAINDGEHVL